MLTSELQQHQEHPHLKYLPYQVLTVYLKENSKYNCLELKDADNGEII